MMEMIYTSVIAIGLCSIAFLGFLCAELGERYCPCLPCATNREHRHASR